ncbi:YDG domain-containing protein [Paucibacter oligotrophus]|uniref:YDG domain-containing protein n=1 Tax=Roseateles oligotrophus TaxID=1769250 RepID=A0ABT2YMZ7_9BURK|nr:YDG domain-containing protein [Roseateles oligotrophus]
MLGGNVTNEGLIEASGGQILLAAGKSIELVDTGSPNLSVRVSAPLGQALNLGTLAAAGGRIDIHAAMVNQQGIARAEALATGAGGEIIMRASEALNLSASSQTSVDGAGQGGIISVDAGVGTALVSGKLSAIGQQGQGGQIKLLGRQIGLQDAAKIDASGRAGGGEVFVGGGQQGKNTSFVNAEAVFFGQGASISADAFEMGDGGRIILWSDKATRAFGSLSSRGGSLNGNGGFIETSGGWLDARPESIRTDAAHGKGGLWLLDPSNIRIADAPFSSNISRGPIFTTTGESAVLSTVAISNALNHGNNVSITTGDDGGQFGDITMSNATISANPSVPVSLILNAHRNITLEGNSTIKTQGSPLSVNLNAGGGGFGGAIVVANSVINTGGGDIYLGGSTTPVGPNISASQPSAVGFDGRADAISISNSVLNANKIVARGFSTATSSEAHGINVGFGSSLLARDIDLLGAVDSNGDFSRVGIILGGTIAATHSISIDGLVNSSVYRSSNSPSGVVLLGRLSLLPLTQDATASMSITGTTNDRLDLNPSLGNLYGRGIVFANSGVALQVGGGASVNISGFDHSLNHGRGSSIDLLAGSIDLSLAGRTSIIGNDNVYMGLPVLAPTGVGLDIGAGGKLSFVGGRLTGSPSSLEIQGENLDFQKGLISLGGDGDILLKAGGNFSAATAGALSIVAGGSLQVQANIIQLHEGTSLGSMASKDAIRISGFDGSPAQAFISDIGAGLNTPNGRWLVYAQNPNAPLFGRGSLMPAFSQHNVITKDTPVAQKTGNGLLFADPQYIDFDSLSLKKVYDGGTGAGNSTHGVGVPTWSTDKLDAANPFTFARKDVATGSDSIPVTVNMFDFNGAPVYGYSMRLGGEEIVKTGQITPRLLTISASKVYDGTTGLNSGVVNLGNLASVGGVTETLNYRNAAASDANVATAAKFIKTITLDDGTGLTSNYQLPATLDAGNAPVHIDKAMLTVSADNKSRLYGQANPALTTTVSGFVNGETLQNSGVTGSASASATAVPSTGVGQSVIAAGAGSLAAANYEFSNFNSGTLNIDKALLTVSADNKSRLYGQANPVLTTTVSGFVNGETLQNSGVTGSASASTTAVPSTGVGQSVITAGAGSLAAANYEFSNFNSGTLNIDKALLTVSADNKSRLYGQANPVLTTTVSGFVNGETLQNSGVTGSASASTTAVPSTGVGQSVITAGAGSLAAANYEFSNFNSGTLNIGKALLTVSADNKSRLYGQANPVLTTTVSGYVNGETLQNSGVTGSASASTTAAPSTGVGQSVITAGAGSLAAANYEFSNFNSGTLSIDKALLTVSADNKSRLYGQANPVLTTTVSGFVNGETLQNSGVTGSGSASTTAVPSTGVGQSVITAGAGSLIAANYEFSNFNSGTLNIDKALLTVSADNKSRLYGQANPVLTTTVSGFVNGETLQNSGVTGSGSASTTAVPSTGVGQVVISASKGSLAAANYEFNNFNSGTLNIGKALLSVSADNKSRLYGQANPVLTTSVSGFVNGETLQNSGVTGSASASTTAVPSTGVGQVVISASTGSLAAANYEFSNFNSGTLSIDKALLTVTAKDQTRKYGELNPVFAQVISGFVNNETSAVVIGSAVGHSDANSLTGVGSALITGSSAGLSASNYDFIAANGTLSISKAPLTVTAVPMSKTYDGKAFAGGNGVIFSGFANDESGSVLGGTLGFSGSSQGARNAGNYVMTPQGLAGVNYAINFVDALLTIDRARVSAVTGITAENKVYDRNTDVKVNSGTAVFLGMVAGDSLSVATAKGSFIDKTAAIGKTVNIIGLSLSGPDAGNYTLDNTTASTQADIAPVKLSLGGLTVNSRTYDGGLVATVSGNASVNALPGDTVNVTPGSASFKDKNVGSAKPVVLSGFGLSGSDAGNYMLSPPTALNANISPAVLQYVASPVKKGVGEAAPQLLGSVSGFVGSDTLQNAVTGSLVFSTQADAQAPAGTYAVLGSGLQATNYNFTQAATNAVALTVTTLSPAATLNQTVSTALNSVVKVGEQSVQSGTGGLLDMMQAPSAGVQSSVVASVTPTAPSESPEALAYTSPSASSVFAAPVPAVNTVTAAMAAPGVSFDQVLVGSMSLEALTDLLNSREIYKKALFADAIHQLELNENLADLHVCLTLEELDSGNCLITEELKQKALASKVSINAQVQASSAGAKTETKIEAQAQAQAETKAVMSSAGLPERRRVKAAALPQIVRKVAVVFGIDEYADLSIPKLSNAVKDARAMAELLDNSLGYETLVIPTASKRAVVATLNRLALELGPKDSVVIYYAGHGELVEATGQGYWQLADSNAKRPETWLSNADINRIVAQIGASQVALISDSCFSGSLATKERIRAAPGSTDPNALLARKSVVVMSSGGNEPVFDEGKNGHSPFAWSLMQNLKQVKSWQTGGNLFERVRFAVAKELPQRPRYSASGAGGHQSGGDYLFEQRQLETRN